MRHLMYGFLMLLLTACNPVEVEVIGIDKAQLRKTLREGQNQFNADLVLNLNAGKFELGYSEWNISINGVFLGKSVLGAETLAMQGGRQKLPFRVIFPDSILVLTSPCTIQLEGYMTVNDDKVKISFSDQELNVLNLTNM